MKMKDIIDVSLSLYGALSGTTSEVKLEYERNFKNVICQCNLYPEDIITDFDHESL